MCQILNQILQKLTEFQKKMVSEEKVLPKPKPEGFIKKDSYGYPMIDQGFRA